MGSVTVCKVSVTVCGVRVVYSILCTCYIVIILVFCVLLFVTTVEVDWTVVVTFCGVVDGTLSFCDSVHGVRVVYKFVIGFIDVLCYYLLVSKWTVVVTFVGSVPVR